MIVQRTPMENAEIGKKKMSRKNKTYSCIYAFNHSRILSNKDKI